MSATTESGRLAAVISAIDPEVQLAASRRGLIEQLAAILAEGAPDQIWLALAVLEVRLPTVDAVTAYRRAVVQDDPVRLVERMLRTANRRNPLRRVPAVRILTGATVVDVHHTARTRLATGIQRVVRKTAQLWAEHDEVSYTGWTSDYSALRELGPLERENALHGTQPHSAEHGASNEITVPWRCTYVLLELAVEPERTARIAALAEFSGNTTASIGYDCVPFTTAETVAPGMPAAFSRNLTALSRFDRIATISAAAAGEYSGWRRMLSSIGLAGPVVQEVFLAAEVEEVDPATIEGAREVLLTGDLPMLLCVGSHEPRKNHLAVLYAAEQLWRSGREFSLVFVGGNSWGSDRFKETLEQLAAAGRPVRSITAISDELLWSAYRLAASTVFPSLNEGFGLPVAEALSVGTPVVTSRFGSMAEIAAQGGAVLVDPRDDGDVLRGIEESLFDDARNAELRREALARTPRTWATYADELWAFVHGGASVPSAEN